MSIEAIITSLLCMGSILTLFVGLAQLVNGDSDIMNRLGHYAWRPAAKDPVQTAKGRQSQGMLTAQLDRALSRRGRQTDITTELARADMQLTPAEFLIMTLTAILGAFGLGLVIFKVIYVALPFSILGYLVPRWYMKFRQVRRQAAFSAQLPDGLSLLSNSLRSGYSFLQSMELLSKETQPPISVEFGRIVREIGLGLTLEDALNNMQRRIRNDDLDLIVTVVLVHHEIGGNLSQILDIINHTVRERVRIKGEIKVLTAQQQLSGYFVGALPFFLSAVLFLINPSYMGQVFNTLCGQLIFFSAFVLVAIALLIIRKIVNIEV